MLNRLINFSLVVALITLWGCGRNPAISSPSAAPNVARGTESSGGGDGYAQEFVALGVQILNDLKQHPIAEIPPDKLNLAIKNTRVESKEVLILSDSEVSAINHPSENPPRIELSQRHWERLGAESYKRYFLVLHEYLGVMGVKDQNYEISSKIDRAGVCRRTPEVRDTIEQLLKRGCLKLDVDDLRFIETLVITGGELESLKINDFYGLSKLNYLSIKMNSLKTLPAGIFSNLPKLTSLYVESEQRTLELTQGVLRGLRNDDSGEFTVWFNGVVSIREGFFEGFGSRLGSLWFYTDARNVDPTLLAPLSSGTRLRIKLAFSAIPPGFFSATRSFEVNLFSVAPPTTNHLNEIVANRNIRKIMSPEGVMLDWSFDSLNGRGHFVCKQGKCER